MEQRAAIPDDFGYGDDQVLLRREARRMLEAECPLSAVRQLVESGASVHAGRDSAFAGPSVHAGRDSAFAGPSVHAGRDSAFAGPSGDDALWARAAEVGWLGIAVPEAYGGTDLSAVSLATLMEEMGRALLPSAFLGTLFAALLLREAASAEQGARWLPAIAQGKLKGTVATLEADGGWDHGVVSAIARRDGGRLLLTGAKVLVVDAPAADLLIGTFREEAGVSLFAVDPRAPGVRVSPDALVDPTRRSAHVEFHDVVVGEDARLGAPGEGLAALDRAMPQVLVALAAEMAGGADRVLQITVDYAKVREQFGRSIGAFQAVKHPLVNVMVDIELTRSLVYRAAAAIDHAPELAARLSRMAKALASDTYANAVAKAVQLHGGIGFTWECDVHLFFRRAQWSKVAFGDAAYQRRKIAEMVLGSARHDHDGDGRTF